MAAQTASVLSYAFAGSDESFTCFDVLKELFLAESAVTLHDLV